MSGVTAGLRALLGRLVAYKVDFAREDYGTDNGAIEWALNGADVISSLLKVGEAKLANVPSDEYVTGYDMNVHQIVIDIDHVAHLVESTTPGHHHLFVEIPPVSRDDYFEWLEASAKIGLVEPGYVSAFRARGFTCVRLPWVQKSDPKTPAEIMPPQEWEAPKPWPVDPAAPKSSAHDSVLGEAIESLHGFNPFD